MHSPAFPFFIDVEHRRLTADERAVVQAVASQAEPDLLASLPNLRVVGRCGCGICPTVFFQPHEKNDRERQVVSYVGRDQNEGLVGVLLWAKGGVPSQLEFYSVDGHDPWSVPNPATLEPL